MSFSSYKTIHSIFKLIAWSPVHPELECWSIYYFSGQSVSLFHHPQHKTNFFLVSSLHLLCLKPATLELLQQDLLKNLLFFYGSSLRLNKVSLEPAQNNLNSQLVFVGEVFHPSDFCHPSLDLVSPQSWTKYSRWGPPEQNRGAQSPPLTFCPHFFWSSPCYGWLLGCKCWLLSCFPSVLPSPSP